MANPGRRAALEALLLVEENSGYSNLVLDKLLRERKLSQRDSALASAIFYGVLEKRLTLDYYLFQCLRDPKKKPERAALEALRCGAYQILFLDRVPDSAAVNETVEVLKETGRERAAGFVNGVLRGLLRKRDFLVLPAGDSPRAWTVRYSMPEPLIRLWMGAYGRETTQRLLEAFEKKAALYVRVNLLKTTEEAFQAELRQAGISCSSVEGLPGAALMENCGSPAALPAFGAGEFHVWCGCWIPSPAKRCATAARPREERPSPSPSRWRAWGRCTPWTYTKAGRGLSRRAPDGWAWGMLRSRCMTHRKALRAFPNLTGRCATCPALALG